MRRLLALVLIAAASLWQGAVQARGFSQAELDALLAPIALYPDAVVSDILVAASYPEEVREAAGWSRANPHLTGEEAVRAAEPMPWHPSVKALVAFPDLLARMEESPQWVADLGTAFREQEPYVMDTVQALRRRAQASGMVPPGEQHWVPYGESIAIYPAQPHIVYLPYYNPYVVYGPWWWPSYRPVYWRPWHARPAVFFSAHVFRGKVDWHRRHVVRHVHHHHHHHAHRPQKHAAPAPVHQRIHTARPIVGSTPSIFSPRHTEQRREFHSDRHHGKPQHRSHNGRESDHVNARLHAQREHRAEHRPSPPIAIAQRVLPVHPLAGSTPKVVPQPRAEHGRDAHPGKQQHGNGHHRGHHGRSHHHR